MLADCSTSYDELDPTDTCALDSAVADVLAVTDHLRERFDQEHLLLVRQSWGSLLGVLAVHERPVAYSGYVGVGQMVNITYRPRFLRRHADLGAGPWRRRPGRGLGAHRTAALRRDARLRDRALLRARGLAIRPFAELRGRGDFSENFLVEEYSLIDKVHLLPAFMDTFGVLNPRARDVDLRETATRFEVPVFFVQGAHDAPGRADAFEEWYPMVEAPVKDRITFDTSGHRPIFEQPDKFVEYLTTTVLRWIR